MKTWNVPSVEELNVELTAGGFFHCKKESCWSHGSHCTTPTTPTDPEIPGDDDFTNPSEES